VIISTASLTNIRTREKGATYQCRLLLGGRFSGAAVVNCSYVAPLSLGPAGLPSSTFGQGLRASLAQGDVTVLRCLVLRSSLQAIRPCAMLGRYLAFTTTHNSVAFYRINHVRHRVSDAAQPTAFR
jgi:hypothetical protein